MWNKCPLITKSLYIWIHTRMQRHVPLVPFNSLIPLTISYSTEEPCVQGHRRLNDPPGIQTTTSIGPFCSFYCIVFHQQYSLFPLLFGRSGAFHHRQWQVFRGRRQTGAHTAPLCSAHVAAADRWIYRLIARCMLVQINFFVRVWRPMGRDELIMGSFIKKIPGKVKKKKKSIKISNKKRRKRHKSRSNNSSNGLTEKLITDAKRVFGLRYWLRLLLLEAALTLH